MPLGKKWSKTKRAWVDVEKEKKLDYDALDEDAWGLLIGYWRAMPDRLLDVMEGSNPLYNLEIIQRVMIRAMCNYSEVFITGGRGMTKTFCAWTSALLMGVLYPGTIRRYYGPSYKMVAELASLVYKEIQAQYPGLTSHWNLLSDSSERFEVETPFHSVISINAMTGDTANAVIAEECSQESDKGEPFKHETYRKSILASIRKKRMINREPDPFYPNYQKVYITSAGRQQNESYEYRKDIIKKMNEGKNAFAIDIPGEVAVLSGIRDISWYNDLKQKLTPEEWLREMASVWTGVSENPVIRDSTLTEAKTLTVMENRHCLDPHVIYVIGYDVSYADGAGRAKCATAVVKLQKQKEPFKADRFLKSLVYVLDSPPPRDSMAQARQLKERWYRFTMEGGNATYIAIDAASYGTAVLEDLHKDLGDGLPPLACVDHSMRELESPDALPVIYPVKATGGLLGSGMHDPEAEMLKYAELEFEHRNVRILTTNIYDGINAYKRYYRIKDDSNDTALAVPYKKTAELCGQIANLKKKVTGFSIREERISKSIQRDMWSAFKYALRYAQILEYNELFGKNRKESSWKDYAEAHKSDAALKKGAAATRIVGGWRGGNGIG